MRHTETEKTIKRVRSHMRKAKLTYSRFARAVGMHPASFKAVLDDEWNPTAKTLIQVERYLAKQNGKGR